MQNVSYLCKKSAIYVKIQLLTARNFFQTHDINLKNWGKLLTFFYFSRFNSKVSETSNFRSVPPSKVPLIAGIDKNKNRRFQTHDVNLKKLENCSLFFSSSRFNSEVSEKCNFHSIPFHPSLHFYM